MGGGRIACIRWERTKFELRWQPYAGCVPPARHGLPRAAISRKTCELVGPREIAEEAATSLLQSSTVGVMASAARRPLPTSSVIARDGNRLDRARQDARRARRAAIGILEPGQIVPEIERVGGADPDAPSRPRALVRVNHRQVARLQRTSLNAPSPPPSGGRCHRVTPWTTITTILWHKASRNHFQRHGDTAHRQAGRSEEASQDHPGCRHGPRVRPLPVPRIPQ